MDRNAILQFLQSKGVDASAMADPPDPMIVALVTAWQKEAGGDPNAAPGGGPPIPGAANMAGGRLPSRVSMQFSEQIGELTAQVTALQETVKATATINDANAHATKKHIATTFCEQMAAGPKPVLTPADLERDPKTGEPLPHTVLARLIRADHTKHHVFTENGAQVSKTELELQMEEIERWQPLHFSERMQQPKPGQTTDPIQAVKDSATKYAEKRNKQIAHAR